MGSLVIKEITNISNEGFFKRKISISFILSDSIKLDLRLFVFFLLLLYTLAKASKRWWKQSKAYSCSSTDRPTQDWSIDKRKQTVKQAKRDPITRWQQRFESTLAPKRSRWCSSPDNYFNSTTVADGRRTRSVSRWRTGPL